MASWRRGQGKHIRHKTIEFCIKKKQTIDGTIFGICYISIYINSIFIFFVYCSQALILTWGVIQFVSFIFAWIFKSLISGLEVSLKWIKKQTFKRSLKRTIHYTTKITDLFVQFPQLYFSVTFISSLMFILLDYCIWNVFLDNPS